MPPAGGPGDGTIPTGCGGREESVCPCIVCPFRSPLPVPLTHPFSPPLPTNGSGDQGDQLGAGRGAGRAGRMSRLCTLAAWSFCFSAPHPSSEHSKSPPGRGRLQRVAQLFIVLVFIVAWWGTKWKPSVSTSSLVHGLSPWLWVARKLGTVGLLGLEGTAR